MKKLIFSIAAAAAGLCFSATSQPEGTTFPVFTAGPDYYADGTLVNDGETYVLVWVAEGAEFGGFNTDGTLVDNESNKLISSAFKAKGNRLQYTPFQDTKGFIPNGGTLMLICLDTRNTEGGQGTLVNSWSLVKAEANKGAFDGGLMKALKGVESASTYLAANLPKDIAQPKIKKVEVKGDEIWVTVERTSKKAYYGLAGAKKPGEGKFDLSKDGTAAQGDEGADIVLKYPVSGNGRFFKVIGGTRSDVIAK